MTNFKEMMRRARRDAEEGDWAPTPGTHEAVVVEGDAFESKAGDAYAKTKLRLVEPGNPDDGRTWDHLMGFKSPQQQQISASQLGLYGLSAAVLDNLEDVDDLARHMAELAGVHVTVSCKAKDGGGVWTNVQMSRDPKGESDVPADQIGLDLNGANQSAPPPRFGAAVAADDDDIPF